MCARPAEAALQHRGPHERGLTWLGSKVSTAAKLRRVALSECEKMYSNRSPSMSLAFARNHMLMEKGPMPAAAHSQQRRLELNLWTCLHDMRLHGCAQ